MLALGIETTCGVSENFRRGTYRLLGICDLFWQPFMVPLQLAGQGRTALYNSTTRALDRYPCRKLSPPATMTLWTVKSCAHVLCSAHSRERLIPRLHDLQTGSAAVSHAGISISQSKHC
ncbi:hypothetical protein BST61_g1419 [Cercospora zeina]